ncbi:MAG: hypothetical protein P1V13_06740 [Rhizobiaceae bacterium]|nr:hypothetical protein [Rhizobiaceae bacterium]
MQEPGRPALAMREAGSGWPAYGGSIHAARYSPNDQINRDNIGTLKKVWQYRTGDMPSAEAEGKYSPENTPLKVGDELYTCSAMGIAIAIDAATGREEWRYDPQVPVDAIPYGATCRALPILKTPPLMASSPFVQLAFSGEHWTRAFWRWMPVPGNPVRILARTARFTSKTGWGRQCPVGIR